MVQSSKKEIVGELQQVFSAANSVIVAHYQGLTVSEVVDLRKRMRHLGAGFRVTKNTLASIAVKGTQFEGLTPLFSGPTAIAYSDDLIAAAKGMIDYAKDSEKLVILGGAINDQLLDVAGVKSLASLPSMDELRAKLIGLINTPATRMAALMQAPGGQLARVVNAYAKKNGA